MFSSGEALVETTPFASYLFSSVGVGVVTGLISTFSSQMFAAAPKAVSSISAVVIPMPSDVVR